MPTLDIAPHILSHERELYVINKPPRWPTSGRTLVDKDCIQFHLMRYHGSMVWVLHQLDADTSGLCFFTTRKALIQPIKTVWSLPETTKDYLAIIHGQPEWKHIEVNAPIGYDDAGQLGVHPRGKHARTQFERIESHQGFSVLRARIFTGRTHQIRIHLQHLGLSLVGEEWYRSPPCTLHPRQALHAQTIHFAENPRLPQHTYTAPIPEDIQQLARQLGLSV